MTNDPDTMRQISRVRVYDYSSAGKELEDDAAVKLASAAFKMGWDARKRGMAITQRPAFADDSLITDWRVGWQRCEEAMAKPL